MDKIALQRALLLKDNSTITVTDLGAGPNNKQQQSNTRKVSDIARSTGMPAMYGELLFRIVEYYQCKTILELGTGLGLSAMYLSAASKKGSLLSIEGDTQIAALARKNLAAVGCRNAEVIVGDIKDKAPEALQRLHKVDLVFMDGNHQYEPTIDYYNTVLPYLHDHSIVILDDIHWSEEMTRAWDELRKRPEVKLSVDLYRMGLLFFNPDFRQAQHPTLYYW